MGFFEWAVQRERQNCANILDKQDLHKPNTLQLVNFKDYGKVYIPQEGELRGHIFNIHGGGLIAGSTNQNRYFCQWLADRGYEVHAIEYPLIPEVRFVEQVGYVCSTIENHWPQDGKPVYLVADSAGCLLALIANAILSDGCFMADDFEYKVSNLPCVFDGVWLNCPLFETVGFNEVGIFMSRGLYGKHPVFKRYLQDPYKWFGEYLPDNTVIIASKYDKLEKQATKMFQTINCSLGYGSKWNKEHDHDWNVLYPYMDDWTIGLNDWALHCLSFGGFAE